MKGSFSVARLGEFERARGNPMVVKALASIEHRAERIKERVIKHGKNFENRWTAREAIGLWKRYVAAQAKLPVPPNTARDLAPDRLMKIAERQVAARLQTRVAKVNQIKMRMGNALIRSLGKQTLTQNFDDVSQTPNQKLTRRRAMRNKP